MQRSWVEVRVRDKFAEATDIVALELVDPHGNELPPFSAGAHIDVEIEQGLVRQYSLCNNNAERHRYMIAVLREPGSRGGSVFLHDRLNKGDIIRISEPRNHFPLHAEAERILLFAGGIGVTPILCMADRLARTRKDFTLHYCVRSLDRAAFRSRLEEPIFAGKVHLHLDSGPDDQKLDLNQGLGPYIPGSHIYVCGPNGFIHWILDAAQELGWPESALHREFFAAAPVPVDTAAEGSFTVRIASTGEEFDVPADRSVIEVLAEAGIELPVSCEQGVCGSCLTRLLEGVPEHRDLYQTEDEKQQNDQFTPCVSRALTPLLVLDL